MARARLTFRRLSGLDRSGSPPPETQPGAPLRPWTIPNAIGYLRIACLPAFVVTALRTPDGVGTAPAALFAAITWGDYADGIAARVTGQYSRLGTLMDPVVDRLVILAGAGVCWRFRTLPRWALAVLAGREAFMLAAGHRALRRGVELRVNWPGRIAVWPLMGAVFLALCGVGRPARWLLHVGLALALLATALYARDMKAST